VSARAAICGPWLTIVMREPKRANLFELERADVVEPVDVVEPWNRRDRSA
jgi:hypothetical protein